MGFLSRTLVPRGVRRAVHPVRSARRIVRNAALPKSVRGAIYLAGRAGHPIDSLRYHALERPVTTALRSGTPTSRGNGGSAGSPPTPGSAVTSSTVPQLGWVSVLLVLGYLATPLVCLAGIFASGNGWWLIAGLAWWSLSRIFLW